MCAHVHQIVSTHLRGLPGELCIIANLSGCSGAFIIPTALERAGVCLYTIILKWTIPIFVCGVEIKDFLLEHTNINILRNVQTVCSVSDVQFTSPLPLPPISMYT